MERSKMHLNKSMCMRRMTLFLRCSLILLVLFHVAFSARAAGPVVLPPDASSALADTLLKFKESLKISGDALSSWKNPVSPCTGKKTNWVGILCDDKGQIWALQLENLGLSGVINTEVLAKLPNLISINLMRNKFEGPLPDLKNLVTLKTLYLSHNNFAGDVPSDLFQGMSLKKLHLTDNKLTGEIPKSLTTLNKLVELFLNDNKFSGGIPTFPQARLSNFNVSNNHLEGEIPETLRKMKEDSFAGNDGLCGAPLKHCSAPSSNVKRNKSSGVSPAVIVIIVLISVLAIFAAILFVIVRRRNKRGEYLASLEAPPASMVQNRSVAPVPKEPDSVSQTSEHSVKAAGGGGGKKADSLKLSFVRDDRQRFDMQDLLKASAEVLGSGCFGSSYKAALLTGPVMVVKRYKQMNNMGRAEFEEHMRRLGRLGHPNLLPLVAYYYKKEEKLLIADHVQRGSLAVHLHGNQFLGQPSLDWPTRLNIVKGVAQGLKYLYAELRSLTAPHGHLKSSNVLVNESYEPLITDYGLIPVVNQEQAQTLMVAYKSPEYVATKRITKKTDVWSLGVLILEILTGKLPTNFLQHGKGSEEDLASWVNSVPRDQWFTQVFDREMRASKNCEGEMLKLLNIGLDCCEGDVEKRWDLREAVERIEELKERDNNGGLEEDFFSSCASEGDITKML